MATEENQAVDEVVVTQPTEAEIAQAEEDKAFASSFNKDTRAEEAPVEVKTQEQVTTDEEVATETVDEQKTEPVETKAGLTEEQLTAMLAKLPKYDENVELTQTEIRKLYGKFGEMNQALQELKKGGNKSEVKLAGATLKNLAEDYPDLAELLAKDLNELGTAQQESPKNDDEINARVAQVREELSKEMQKNLLMMQHRDFGTVTQTDEFKVWMQTLPEKDQKDIDNSWDAIYLGEKLTEFKTWRDKKQAGTQDRKERLERAITPKGTQAAIKPMAMTEEDGFRAAFTKR
jgi:hypothetical protein